MRKHDQIIERVKERQPADPFGFEWTMYLDYLPYEKAEQFFIDLKEKPKKDNWRDWPADKRVITERMKDYMTFAFEKANNFRGLSANRSIFHFVAWLWLVEEDQLLEKVMKEYDTNYQYYGKDILVMICKHYGWNPKEMGDDGVRKNSEDEN